eukprot:TRINITY_DN3103_c0_g1_i1.p1 TRINITY_DN3103_c0_g1~~TRINITY_DN3103_c0_g1_i1.p1  ORF type:complete len:174 (+),score=42.12 TRINITY_DN3103_c0_g1_i1:48-524(+)
MSIQDQDTALLAAEMCRNGKVKTTTTAIPDTPPAADPMACWIGLHDTATQGIFVWIDDSPSTFEYWDDFEGPKSPQISDADEDKCAVNAVWSDHWYDRDCLKSGDIKGFVVSMDVIKDQQLPLRLNRLQQPPLFQLLRSHVLCVDTGRSSETAKAHRG